MRTEDQSVIKLKKLKNIKMKILGVLINCRTHL